MQTNETAVQTDHVPPQNVTEKKRIRYPLGDDVGSIELVDYMGGDLAVVNDARASFERVSTELTERDKKLINYLITHEHTSPTRGTVFKFRVTAPLFICRQWWKHIIASVHASDQIGWNEKSYRYKKAEMGMFYVPKMFLEQSEDNRQASGDPLPEEQQKKCRERFERACQEAFTAYNDLVALGVSREVARGVLPQTVYTTWVWTCSLQAVINFIELRAGEGAQNEIQRYATAARDLIADIAPETMAAWNRKMSAR